jgi:hypothetical protein
MNRPYNQPYNYSPCKKPYPDPGKIDSFGKKEVPEAIQKNKYQENIYKAVILSFKNIAERKRQPRTNKPESERNKPTHCL